MMIRYILFLLVLILAQIVVAGEDDLLLLKNEHVVLGVKPELGGRVMLFRRGDGENVLDSNPAHWSLQDKDIPPADPKSPFVQYNGHIVWVGPYEKWWEDTDGKISPPNTGFCPDPYLLYDRYEVVEHTKSKLVLQGHTSRLNGMKMRKEFELVEDGKVKLSVFVTNMRERIVEWDIWTNTRFNPKGAGGFSIVPRGNLRFDFSAWYPLKERPLSYDIKDGAVSFVHPQKNKIETCSYYGKLSFNHYRVIRGVYNDNLFMKEAVVDEKPGPCSKGHYPVEVYQRYTADKRGDIIELEFHSPAFKLKPGETASFSEIWTLMKKN